MRQVTIDELRQLASDARESIWAQAEAYGREPKIYLHWTAGHYANGDAGQMYLNEYHIAVDCDGKIYVDNPLDEVLSHTWQRNTGAVAITLPCGYQSGSNWLGPEPPTEAQIEGMAQAIVAVADGLWLTIDKAHVLTHGEAANNEDGYYDAHQPYAWWNDSYGDGNTRGDLEYLGTDESPFYNPEATDGSRGGDVLRGKANWYRKLWEENSKK
jgi:hypothetical protein